LEGYSTEEVADFLEVEPRSVRRWMAASKARGIRGLIGHPAPGRPPKLTRCQEKVIRRWLQESPSEHGFPTELWSAPRLAQLIQEHWQVTLHPNYLAAWLRARGFSPQKPRRRAREQQARAVEGWLACDWPRIKKTHAATAPALP
jgi:transposase